MRGLYGTVVQKEFYGTLRGRLRDERRGLDDGCFQLSRRQGVILLSRSSRSRRRGGGVDVT